MGSLSRIVHADLEVVRVCFSWDGNLGGSDLWVCANSLAPSRRHVRAESASYSCCSCDLQRISSLALLRHYVGKRGRALTVNLCLTFTDMTLYERQPSDNELPLEEQPTRPNILPSKHDWEAFKRGLLQPPVNDLSPIKFRLQILHLKTYDRALVERIFYGEIDSSIH